jgi:hypothetical protein
MNRIARWVFAAVILAMPGWALAAGNQYNDPAMSFTAPADYHAVPVPTHDPANFDDPAVMAIYIKNPGKQDFSQITLRMESFDGDATGFEMNVENDMRNQGGDVFIKKTATKLSNGMPAYWQEITMGSGFDQMKIFQYVWADGVRGVQLSLMTRSGAVDEPAAKAALSNVSAVAYPKNRY